MTIQEWMDKWGDYDCNRQPRNKKKEDEMWSDLEKVKILNITTTASEKVI